MTTIAGRPGNTTPTDSRSTGATGQVEGATRYQHELHGPYARRPAHSLSSPLPLFRSQLLRDRGQRPLFHNRYQPDPSSRSGPPREPRPTQPPPDRDAHAITRGRLTNPSPYQRSGATTRCRSGSSPSEYVSTSLRSRRYSCTSLRSLAVIASRATGRL